jgi:hypothetical protein
MESATGAFASHPATVAYWQRISGGRQHGRTIGGRTHVADVRDVGLGISVAYVLSGFVGIVGSVCNVPCGGNPPPPDRPRTWGE